MANKKAPKPNGAIFYRGASLIDGAPIVGIVTGLRRGSKNSKTGAMLQTWILRSRINPIRALETGKDASICGDCSLRGNHGKDRGCYVTVPQAPLSVYKAYKRGNYRLLNLQDLAGRIIRLGSYGDPAAIPTAVWSDMLSAGTVGWTGYTSQWKTADPLLRQWLMASAKTPDERDRAIADGWRTFRVRTDLLPLDPSVEISCPASAEMSHRVTCEDCRLCQGRTIGAKSIAILPHGNGASTLIPLATLRSALLRKVA